RLKRKEVLIRLEVGIILADCQKPSEGPRELILGILELLHLLGISQLGRVDLHLRGLGARLRHRGQYLPFLSGVALHGGDKIGDEIGAALIIVLHVRPFRLGLLLVSRDVVITAAGYSETKNDSRENGTNA